jgi:N-acylneuraminate cytidylyltransferase
MKKILAIIPARGGSKGILRKNIRLIAGKPLIGYTIEQALKTPSINRVVVSTDDAEITTVSQQFGAEVIQRPKELSNDTATSESALIHVLDYLKNIEGYEPDLIVFLQATSPIRESDDIENAINLFLQENADSLLSVIKSHPWLWRINDGQPESFNFNYRNRPRRQDRVPEYLENGSIYIFKPWVLVKFNNRLGGKIALYEMNEKSLVDIDEPWDLELCEHIMLQSPVIE